MPDSPTLACSGCGSENPSSARFCNQCGESLGRECACGAQLPADARFCSACGQRVENDAAATRHAPAQAERRLLTVVFCDLVGYTRLGQQLDPEDLRDILRRYQNACQVAVEHYDGYVAQYLGDGVLIYFGYPAAHDDDADRAVRAALEIQGALAQMRREQPTGVPAIEARIGIHSGPVLMSEVGGGTGSQTLAVGDTANVASRLQAFARAGGIAISQETLRLLRGGFVTRPLGAREFKGAETPIHAHEVERAEVGRGRPTNTRPTPMIGREDERALFQELWHRARGGEGAVVAISGEPGIGKSRLLESYREEIGQDAHAWLELRCSSYAHGSPFQPLIDTFDLALDLSSEPTPEDRFSKVEAALGTLPGLSLEFVLPHLAPLLGLSTPPHYTFESASAEVMRDRTLRALIDIVLANASAQPVVLACEDLQWSDPSTRDLLTALMRSAPRSRLLLVLTWRPEFESPWSPEAMHSVALSRLGDAETRAIVAAVADSHALTDGLLDEILQRAEGVPLFAEELAKSVIDGRSDAAGALRRGDGRRSVEEPAVPSTLQGSLMGRLDRLSSAKVIAQLCATISREFAYDLIATISGLEDSILRAGLAQLVESEILLQQGVPPDSSYAFKHALLQDTAYESQPRSRRRELHGIIAETLEKKYPKRAAAEPHRVARHATLGGQGERAITYYGLAGQRAVERLANAEAANYYTRALDLLDSVPAGTSRDLRESELRLAALGPLYSLGYESEEVLAELARLEELVDEIPAGPQRIPILLGLAGFLQAMGDLPGSGPFAAQLLEIVEPIGIPVVEAAAHLILGSLHLCTNTIEAAMPHLERAREIAGDGSALPPPGPLDLDLTAITYSCYALASVSSGRPGDARDAMGQCTERAAAAEHLYGKTSHAHATMIAYYLDDPVAAGEIAETCLGHIEGLGFRQVEAVSLIFRSWARVHAGDFSATRYARDGIRLLLESGSRAGVHQHHLVAAEIFTIVGDFETANRFIDDAAVWIDKTGEHAGFDFQIPMFHAMVMLAGDAPDLPRARALLLEATELLRPYGSPWIQLRSDTLLGRVGLLGHEPEAARAQLEATLSELPDCESESRIRLARRLVEELASV